MRTEENNTNNNSIFDSEIEKILIEKDRIISQLSLKNEELSGKNEELPGRMKNFPERMNICSIR